MVALATPENVLVRTAACCRETPLVTALAWAQRMWVSSMHLPGEMTSYTLHFQPDDVARCADRLLAIFRSHLPRKVTGTDVRDWSVTGPAMLAKAAGTPESLCALPPSMTDSKPSPSRRSSPTTDATVLLRSLYEGVLVFMWIAIAPPSHLPRWLKKCASESLRFDADWRSRGMPLLDARNLKFCSEMKAATRLREAPDRAQMAKEVDKKWQGRFPGLPQITDQDFGLTMMGLYQHAYRLGCAAAHYDLTEMKAFFTVDPLGDTFIHAERAGEYFLYPWLFAPWVFALGLCVLSDKFGWPHTDDVFQSLQGVYVIRDHPSEASPENL